MGYQNNPSKIAIAVNGFLPCPPQVPKQERIYIETTPEDAFHHSRNQVYS